MLVDSQAAIKALKRCTLTSITEFNYIRIRNYCSLVDKTHVSIAWIPGHAGVYGNIVADCVAKSKSK